MLFRSIATTFPFAITKADLDRGEDRFNIYCAPCHGRSGDGNGIVVQRGFKPPPSYHIDRLRQAPPGYLFIVITSGFGAMSDYSMQLTAEDRWRVVAYIRALQLAQQGKTADVPAEDLKRLQIGEPAAAAGDTKGHGGN